MQEIFTEDDLDTIQGFARYQRFDLERASLEGMEALRRCFAVSLDRRARYCPVGRMALKPNDVCYAVAIEDGDDLWVPLWIKRSSKGDIYVFWPHGCVEGEDPGSPHVSYHRDGTYHSKSYEQVTMPPQKRHPLLGDFKRCEHLGIF
ncbi:MAG TPA: hypothetical protein VEK74_11215 [Burkholderiaceae bacterium]|nr:hypothetical protein [Burkholderiaceae bacterium]